MKRYEKRNWFMSTGYRNNKWYVLILGALACALAVLMPEMCMPVLFKEISDEMGLSLVQVGAIWGMVPLGSIIFLLVGGVLCDRFGVKRTVTMACLLGGIAGAMRGLSNGFVSLVVLSCVFGIITSIIPLAVTKANQVLFTNRQMGLANGVIRAGAGIGAAIGSMISASVLSPWLGGWRNVLFFYGAIAVLIGIIWLLTVKETRREETKDSQSTVPFREGISHVLSIKAIWLLGFTLFAYAGGVQGIAGYLPLYLRESGWQPIQADGVFTVYNLAATAGVIPLALLSDRLGKRKNSACPRRTNRHNLYRAITGCQQCVYLGHSCHNRALPLGLSGFGGYHVP
ncbi:nitrate/nitrite transporter [Chloroflexota bacterium]